MRLSGLGREIIAIFGTLVDIWTIDPDTAEGQRQLFQALESGADQITTNLPVLAAAIAARRAAEADGT